MTSLNEALLSFRPVVEALSPTSAYTSHVHTHIHVCIQSEVYTAELWIAPVT